MELWDMSGGTGSAAKCNGGTYVTPPTEGSTANPTTGNPSSAFNAAAKIIYNWIEANLYWCQA